MQDVIQIRAAAKRNVLTTSMFGVGGLLLGAAIFGWLPKSFFLAGIFATSAGIVALLIAWFKFREPIFSIELSHDSICYQHRKGQWYVNWDNIQRIDVPRAHRDLQLEDLSLVGIKLKDYRPFLTTTPIRLMIHLLMEQRPLLLLGDKAENASGESFSNDLVEDDKHKLPDGTILTGIQAMLANRMTKLRQRLGYDLFISVSELDRSEQDFVQLLRECQEYVQNKVK
ncbi:DUF2982 domain-containing protein [Paraglaciecola sp. L1A13]|uniref:DUF2982 domain-containing protein n=1 Tax=Paraglaciecola sp. L1A13 TaxID=2686359 RepID=UPI00131DA7A4|nr:DUF2982 domain-containing protein [Paraglaciecola sp. L1A13]